MAPATDKQVDGIIRRANQLEGTRFRYLSQVRGVIGLSSFQCQRGLTGPQASAIIEDLDRRLAAKAEAGSAPKTAGEILDAAGVTRETVGRTVRRAWTDWAAAQPDPKPSWLVPWDGLSPADQEADMQIGERLFQYGWEARGQH